MKLLSVILSLLCLTANAQLVYEETFENARYFNVSAPLTPKPTARIHGIENCIPDDTAKGTPYDWTLRRTDTPFMAFRGNRYVQFQIRKDQPLVGSAMRFRSEVTILKWPDESYMQRNMWYSFAILFPADSFAYSTHRDAINQWYEDGSTETTLRTQTNHFFLETFATASGTSVVQYDLFATALEGSRSVASMQLMKKNEWHEFTFHFLHSTGSDGYIDIWRDGLLIHQITGRNIHLMLPKWKLGDYNSGLASTENFSREVYFDNIRVGDSTATLQNMISTTAANQPPTARAGVDQTITLPTSSVSVNGSASTDGDGTIVSYLWSKISGPATYAIVSPTSVSTNITGLVQGVYQFQLTVTDNNGAANSDVMQVTVNPSPNLPPVSNAGADQTITLPTSSVTVNGSGSSDPDGTITAYLWTKVSGTGGTITSPASVSTTITGLTAGTYVYNLRVTDNGGLTANDIIQINVNPAPNISPTSNPGSNQTITLPTNMVTVDGSASTDPDGTITGYLWAYISGPSSSSIVSATSASTDITGLTEGIYQFRLTVTDNNGATGSNLIQITVLPTIPPPNQPPVADAGSPQTITLPTNTATIDGSTSYDPDGAITSYAWIKSGGPATGNITSPGSAITGLTSLVEGVYTFQLTVTDNLGDTGTASVQITVLPALNQLPIADAGANQSITLPVNYTTLDGTGSYDPDGTITDYLWSQIDGPNIATIVDATGSTTDVTGMIAGTYIFQLKVTDDFGDTAVNSMQVLVNPKVQVPPIVNAGPDTTIYLPVNLVDITGSAIDPDGTVTVEWVKVSGPNIYQLTNADSTTVTIGNLSAGVYVFRLIGTDDEGNIATDDMTIAVVDNNIPVLKTYSGKPRKSVNEKNGVLTPID